MNEFNLTTFTNDIRKSLYDNFPYESDAINSKKHPNRQSHIRDVALTIPTIDKDKIIFDIGNDFAEEFYTYYHILQDSEVIRKRGRGTTKSRGSQASIKKLSDRDYAQVNWNGKTYSREYQKNVRGQRSRTSKGTYYIVGSDGKAYAINKNANYYRNVHYKYIERILNVTLPWIANENGLRMGRTQISDLQDDYETSEYYGLVASALQSFGEE